MNAKSATRALRAADLKPGDVYYSPTGRLCMLLQPAGSGLSRSCYLSASLTKNRRPSDDEGFAISAANSQTIAAMRPAELGGPITVPVFLRNRGMAA